MSENDIPFANMSRQEAESKPWSPYAEFCTTLVGYIVFHRVTRQEWSKSELFTQYQDSPEELQMISERRHPHFKFISRVDWEE